MTARSARGVALALAALGIAVTAARPAAAEARPCLACHETKIAPDAYARSVHADLACTACHVKTGAAPAGEDACVATFARASETCARCHAEAARDHAGSVHDGTRLPIGCPTCHADVHALTARKHDKLAIAETCLGCHSRQRSWLDSIHHDAIAKGRDDAATCTDCHGLHAIAKVDNDAAGRLLHTRACLRCHDDREKMARNGVTLVAGETFLRSFHGKNVALGYPEAVAGCADCHGAHGVQRAEDPRSSVHADHRVATCRQCHPAASEGFAAYLPHADDHDRTRFPALYWTRLGMTTLLVGVFAFFWLHSALWALRSFVERHRHGAGATPGARPGKVYRRFETRHVVMHVVVVVSFLTLAVTGLPLEFSDVAWGRALMRALGGAHRAQTIHHGAAVVTFGYFLVALAMSGRFLARRGGEGVLARLFGPESLFPNRRDLRDAWAMFRWFLGRGPKPTFERWTYWEKFDFLAVFWGMIAIGVSGLMLWFPAFFARLLPGWAFNVATLVHSDEALLATGFIFTVHFFNTHLRPEKFPMDTVIFDGRIAHGEMEEERGDQLRRYEAEGRLAELAAGPPPGVAFALIARLFGVVAVGIGVTLAVVMAYALLGGGR